jgi:hypothetical protein
MTKSKKTWSILALITLLVPTRIYAAANLFQQLATEFQTAFGYLKIIIGLVAAGIVVSNGLSLVSKMGNKNQQGDITKDILYFCIGLVLIYFVLSNYTTYAV